MTNLIRIANHTTKTFFRTMIVVLMLLGATIGSFCRGESPKPSQDGSNHLSNKSSSSEMIKCAQQVFAGIAEADTEAIPKAIDDTADVLKNLVSDIAEHRGKGGRVRVAKGCISVAPVSDKKYQAWEHVQGTLVAENQKGRRLEDIVIAFDMKVASDKGISLRGFCFPEQERVDDLMDEALKCLQRVGPLFTAAFNRGDGEGIQKLLAEEKKPNASGYGIAFVGDLDLCLRLAKGDLSSVTATVGSTGVSREPEVYGRTNILVKSKQGKWLYKFQLIYKNLLTASAPQKYRSTLSAVSEDDNFPVTMPQTLEKSVDALTVSMATDVQLFDLGMGDTLAAIPRRCRPVLYTLGAARDWKMEDGLKNGVAQILQGNGKWKTLPEGKVFFPSGISRGYAPSTVKLGAAVPQNNGLVVFNAGSLLVKDENLNALRDALSRWQICPTANRDDLAFTFLSESSCRCLHEACLGFLSKPRHVPFIAANKDRWWKVVTDEATDVNTRANILLRMRSAQLLKNDKQAETIWRDLIKTCKLRYFDQLVKKEPQVCLSASLDLLGSKDPRKRDYAAVQAWTHFRDEDAVYKRVLGICEENPDWGVEWCFPLLFGKWREPSAVLLGNELEKATGKKLESLMLSVWHHAAGEYGKVIHESFTSKPRAFTKNKLALEYAVYYFLGHRSESRECRSYLKDIQRELPEDTYLYKRIQKKL